MVVGSGGTMGLIQVLDGCSSLAKPKTILIADDSDAMRATIRRSLQFETTFVVCGEASDGVEAVSKAKELSPDLIILDVRMPHLNGLEVAGILRYAFPRIRIILLSMYDEQLSHPLTSVIRVDAVLSKSDGLDKLIDNVENLLRN
jgi:DNA-binding NarL/FixJ family response regulator